MSVDELENQIPMIDHGRPEALRYDEAVRRKPGYLQVDSLVKHYRSRSLYDNVVVKAVDNVSLNVSAGEVLGLVGESGCGKSTFARLVARLSTATAGRISINGDDWLALRGEALRQRRPQVQLIFQDARAALDPRMKIGTSLESPLTQHRIGSAAERRQRVMAMLEEVGLDTTFYERRPRHCSGGELQRIVIGRALLLDPGLLICDEPTSALDASMTTQILNLLVALRQRRNLTMLFISHDLRVIRFMCDRIAVMYLGKIVEIADTRRLFNKPAHPYTQSLMAAALLDQNGLSVADDLVKGDLPSPLHLPDGCTFHSRCPWLRDDCTVSAPTLKQTKQDHYVRCHYWSKLRAETGRL